MDGNSAPGGGEGITVARGKYATRAANTRGEVAVERAARLEQQFSEERAASAREIASLKAEVQRLAGQLTSAVKGMAAAEVERVRTECAGVIKEAEAKRAANATAVIELLSPATTELSFSVWQQIVTLLDVPGIAVGSRSARRTNGKKLVAAATRHEQAIDRAQRENGVARQFAPTTLVEIKAEIDRRQKEIDRMRGIADEMEAEGARTVEEWAGS